VAGVSGSRRRARGVVRAARRGGRHSELVFMVFASATTLRSSSPDAAEGLFETEERLEAGRIPEAAPVDRAGILDEVDRGGRHGVEPEAEEAPHQAACERLRGAPGGGPRCPPGRPWRAR